MSGIPERPGTSGGRFPGFDVMSQADHWDDATRSVVQSRLGRLPDVRFFTAEEESAAGALFDQLLDQHDEPRVPIVQLVDARLAEGQTDGWHYDNLPPDDVAWRRSLRGLDEDARERFQVAFALSGRSNQRAILEDIHRAGSGQWRDLPADRLWGLWTRYACTAFYSHPRAWGEIGFSGPAYPRGYKNLGLDRLEPFEVADANPSDNPIPRSRT